MLSHQVKSKWEFVDLPQQPSDPKACQVKTQVQGIAANYMRTGVKHRRQTIKNFQIHELEELEKSMPDKNDS